MTDQPAKLARGARDLLWIDTETTGLDPERHELLELAAVRRTADRREIGRFSVRIRPTHLETAEPRALEVNGYTPEGWADAVPLAQALEQLVALAGLGDHRPTLAGHNVGFDRGFIVEAFRQCAGVVAPSLDHHAVDTSVLAWPLCARGVIDSVSLAAVCTYLGISNEGAHGALRDVERAIEVYDRLVPPSPPWPILGSYVRGARVTAANGVTRMAVHAQVAPMLAQLLAGEIFAPGGPNVVEALVVDAESRELVVEVRRLYGQSMAQLRLGALARAEAAERDLALANVRIARLEEALAAREGAL